MPLNVLLNAFAPRVANLLQVVCPGTAVDNDSGRVLPPVGSGSAACEKLLLLAVQSSAIVAILGQRSDFPLEEPAPGDTGLLRQRSGATKYNKYPGTTAIHIVLDVMNCDGRGYWTWEKGTGNQIPFPLDAVLFHELDHAVRLVSGTFDANNAEVPTIVEENTYRAAAGMPLRLDNASGVGGGCL